MFMKGLMMVGLVGPMLGWAEFEDKKGVSDRI